LAGGGSGSARFTEIDPREKERPVLGHRPGILQPAAVLLVDVRGVRLQDEIGTPGHAKPRWDQGLRRCGRVRNAPSRCRAKAKVSTKRADAGSAVLLWGSGRAEGA